MKKDELVHLHTLLVLLRADLERRGVAEPADFADYEALEVSPMAIYGPKADHEQAVRALASALVTAVDREDEHSVTVASN